MSEQEKYPYDKDQLVAFLVGGKPEGEAKVVAKGAAHGAASELTANLPTLKPLPMKSILTYVKGQVPKHVKNPKKKELLKKLDLTNWQTLWASSNSIKEAINGFQYFINWNNKDLAYHAGVKVSDVSNAKAKTASASVQNKIVGVINKVLVDKHEVDSKVVELQAEPATTTYSNLSSGATLSKESIDDAINKLKSMTLDKPGWALPDAHLMEKAAAIAKASPDWPTLSTSQKLNFIKEIHYNLKAMGLGETVSPPKSTLEKKWEQNYMLAYQGAAPAPVNSDLLTENIININKKLKDLEVFTQALDKAFGELDEKVHHNHVDLKGKIDDSYGVPNWKLALYSQAYGFLALMKECNSLGLKPKSAEALTSVLQSLAHEIEFMWHGK